MSGSEETSGVNKRVINISYLSRVERRARDFEPNEIEIYRRRRHDARDKIPFVPSSVPKHDFPSYYNDEYTIIRRT